MVDINTIGSGSSFLSNTLAWLTKALTGFISFATKLENMIFILLGIGIIVFIFWVWSKDNSAHRNFQKNIRFREY